MRYGRTWPRAAWSLTVPVRPTVAVRAASKRLFEAGASATCRTGVMHITSSKLQ
jgi:hypothetical protein